MVHAAQQHGDPSLKVRFVWSATLHAALAATVIVSALINGRGENWGGSGGGSVSVGLVSSLPAIPLPKPAAVTPSRVVDETKGLYKAEPVLKVVPPITAQPIPVFKDTKKTKIVPSHPSKVLEDKTPPPINAVPYGGGGVPALPYSAPGKTISGATQGDMSFDSGSGGGVFGSKYSWYVDAVRNRISSNWLQSMVDPSVRFAPRAVITFQILRDGTIANIQILQSSGNRSVDDSARRAIMSSSPVNKLPGDYSAPLVNVQFWFEFKR